MGQSVSTEPPRLLSLEDWAALPEDEPGELVDGRLEEEEVSDFVHEAVVTWLIAAFFGWIVPAGGVVGGSDAKFAVRPRRGRKPDVTVFFPGRPPPRRGLVRTPPDIAVEVLSATPRDERRDRVEKLDEYAAFGVRFYWIIDPDSQSLEIFELGTDRRYVRALGATSGVIDTVPGCPDFRLDLDDLWAYVARLAPPEA